MDIIARRAKSTCGGLMPPKSGGCFDINGEIFACGEVISPSAAGIEKGKIFTVAAETQDKPYPIPLAELPQISLMNSLSEECRSPHSYKVLDQDTRLSEWDESVVHRIIRRKSNRSKEKVQSFANLCSIWKLRFKSSAISFLDYGTAENEIAQSCPQCSHELAHQDNADAMRNLPPFCASCESYFVKEGEIDNDELESLLDLFNSETSHVSRGKIVVITKASGDSALDAIHGTIMNKLDPLKEICGRTSDIDEHKPPWKDISASINSFTAGCGPSQSASSNDGTDSDWHNTTTAETRETITTMKSSEDTILSKDIIVASAESMSFDTFDDQSEHSVWLNDKDERLIRAEEIAAEEKAILGNPQMIQTIGSTAIIQKSSEDFSLTADQCFKCCMPLMSNNGNNVCVTCPQILKTAAHIARTKRTDNFELVQLIHKAFPTKEAHSERVRAEQRDEQLKNYVVSDFNSRGDKGSVESSVIHSLRDTMMDNEENEGGVSSLGIGRSERKEAVPDHGVSSKPSGEDHSIERDVESIQFIVDANKQESQDSWNSSHPSSNSECKNQRAFMNARDDKCNSVHSDSTGDKENDTTTLLTQGNVASVVVTQQSMRGEGRESGEGHCVTISYSDYSYGKAEVLKIDACPGETMIHTLQITQSRSEEDNDSDTFDIDCEFVQSSHADEAELISTGLCSDTSRDDLEEHASVSNVDGGPYAIGEADGSQFCIGNDTSIDPSHLVEKLRSPKPILALHGKAFNLKIETCPKEERTNETIRMEAPTIQTQRTDRGLRDTDSTSGLLPPRHRDGISHVQEEPQDDIEERYTNELNAYMTLLSSFERSIGTSGSEEGSACASTEETDPNTDTLQNFDELPSSNSDSLSQPFEPMVDYIDYSLETIEEGCEESSEIIYDEEDSPSETLQAKDSQDQNDESELSFPLALNKSILLERKDSFNYGGYDAQPVLSSSYSLKSSSDHQTYGSEKQNYTDSQHEVDTKRECEATNQKSLHLSTKKPSPMDLRSPTETHNNEVTGPYERHGTDKTTPLVSMSTSSKPDAHDGQENDPIIQFRARFFNENSPISHQTSVVEREEGFDSHREEELNFNILYPPVQKSVNTNATKLRSTLDEEYIGDSHIPSAKEFVGTHSLREVINIDIDRSSRRPGHCTNRRKRPPVPEFSDSITIPSPKVEMVPQNKTMKIKDDVYSKNTLKPSYSYGSETTETSESAKSETGFDGNSEGQVHILPCSSTENLSPRQKIDVNYLSVESDLHTKDILPIQRQCNHVDPSIFRDHPDLNAIPQRAMVRAENTNCDEGRQEMVENIEKMQQLGVLLSRLHNVAVSMKEIDESIEKRKFGDLSSNYLHTYPNKQQSHLDLTAEKENFFDPSSC